MILSKSDKQRRKKVVKMPHKEAFKCRVLSHSNTIFSRYHLNKIKPCFELTYKFTVNMSIVFYIIMKFRWT